MRPMKRWFFIFGGFLQTQRDIDGLDFLWRRAIDAVGNDPHARVERRDWDCNVNNLAEWVFKQCPQGQAPRIVVAGFSFGGYAASRFCYALRERGIEVEFLILSDPVYRHWFFAGNWRAYFPDTFPITIPDTVKQVSVFRQREEWLRGHKLRFDNPSRTILVRDQIVVRRHIFMDDLHEFHDESLRALLATAE